MPPGNHKFDLEIQINSLENPEILENINFQLMAQNQGENLVRENAPNYIQKFCQYHKVLT